MVALAADVGSLAFAQVSTRKAPTPAEWTALAKLPDFNGVWETGGGGGARAGGAPPANAGAAAGNRGAAAPSPARRGGGAAGGGRGGGPSLTPEYAAKRAALLAK